MLFSLSKSFTSTAVGLAIADGKLKLDDPVLGFFPDEAPAEPSANLKAMRIRDLLTMSTGHHDEDVRDFPYTGDESVVKNFLARPVSHKPGTFFFYNTPASYMLSAIVQKVTGQAVVDYLKPRLFDPLGIENPTWDASKQGVSLGGFGLNVRTEDIARFGQLYLQKLRPCRALRKARGPGAFRARSVGCRERPGGRPRARSSKRARGSGVPRGFLSPQARRSRSGKRRSLLRGGQSGPQTNPPDVSGSVEHRRSDDRRRARKRQSPRRGLLPPVDGMAMGCSRGTDAHGDAELPRGTALPSAGSCAEISSANEELPRASRTGSPSLIRFSIPGAPKLR